MGSHIEYQGEHLGNIHPNTSRGELKWILVTDSFGALEKLLNLNPSDVLTIDGNSETYERFRKKILTKTSSIYTSTEDYVFSEFPFPVGGRVPKELLKEKGLI